MFTWFPPLTAVLSPSTFTNSLTGIVAVLPSTPGESGVVTVALPLASTTTVAPGFTASTAALILAISSGCNDSLFPTRTLSAGLLMLFPAFAFGNSVDFLIKSSASITAVLPSGVVTIAFPLLSTTTTAPGFTASTLALIASFTFSSSSGDNAAISSTTVCEFGLLMSSPPFAFLVSSSVLNRSPAGIVAVLYTFVPSGLVSIEVTVAFPSASYLTLVS